MNNFLDKLQQAWQSQCSKPLDFKPDLLLKVVRYERLVHLCVDVGLVVCFFCAGTQILGEVREIRKDWPWLIYCASLAWVIGFILFNRWRRRRGDAHYDEPLLAHVEWSIKDIEHQMWLDRYSPWWYLLPITLGCMIPPVLFFAMDYGKRPFLDNLIPFVHHEGVFVATFAFVYLIMKFGVHRANEKYRQELEGLRALRDSLLDAEGPHG